jgi:hypothetical protein
VDPHAESQRALRIDGSLTAGHTLPRLYCGPAAAYNESPAVVPRSHPVQGGS